MQMNLFEIASRQSYRFQSSIGDLTVEQLWNLPVTTTKANSASLSAIAEQLNTELTPSSELDWLNQGEVKSELQQDLKNKLGIVKHIVETRYKEAKEKQDAEAKSQLLKKLQAEQLRRKEESLYSLPDDELAEAIKQNQ